MKSGHLKKIIKLILSMCFTGLLFVPLLGRADITPLNYHAPPSGGGVSPTSPHQTIRMESEKVTIRLMRSRYTVDAVFYMFNSGETTTEWVGFPKRAMGRSPGPHGGVRDFIRFEVSVNDRNRNFVEERSLAKRSYRAQHRTWMIGRVRFPGRARTTIRVSYAAAYDYCGFMCDMASYVYGTGLYWKDSIGKASFTIDAMEIGGTEHAKAKFSLSDTQKHVIHRKPISGDVVTYEIEDFVPDPSGALSVHFIIPPAYKSDRTALVHAAEKGRLKMVQALLKKGADVNATNYSGRTPLMGAASGGQLQIVKLLLDKGSVIEAHDCHGHTALIKAAGEGHAEVVKLLLDLGAEVDVRARHGRRALHHAARRGHPEVARVLLAGGAEINARDELTDSTPLMHAAHSGHLEVVKVLLEKGADVNAKDKNGVTALTFANGKNIDEIEKVLKAHGATK